ncbi:hypothetical protein AYL99_04635 [Fonsecaea erecta]|uniref:Uncharacterized protein n=1 Tax=Fonsecaea erecta TaxID=1367422 RepID=A0A178ZRX9_9EURO|nr:hypothetical protein AYL99_04635 [Fonsecaea erecta]OAP62432.1 hypothetical protein AYL99_04635 [Fonsecaea erecta]
MTPRVSRSDSRPQLPRTGQSSHASSNWQPILAPYSRRLSSIGSTTQLEGFAPIASPRSRQSPTSRGNVHLLAAARTGESHGQLGRSRSAIKRPKYSRMNHTSVDRFIPPEHGSAEILELPEIDSDSTPEEVENIIAHMIDYLLKWTNGELVEGPATILQDIKVIHDSLQNMLDLPEDVISSSLVHSALRTLRKQYEVFVSSWAQAVHSAFNGKLHRIESQLKRHPAALSEAAFTFLMSDIRNACSNYALPALLDSAQDNSPLLVSEVAAKRLLNRSVRLHEIFQNATYVSEQQQLWLLIWRALKTVFTAFEQGGAPTSPTNTERDRNFFKLPGIYGELKRLISSPDAVNPRSIEDMVGKYCRYIYKCQVDRGNKYESLQRPRDTPLESHTKEALREFIQTGKFEISTLSKIHFAVARFNEISGGPVEVRRWQHDTGNREWEFIALDLLSPALKLTPERRPSYSDVPSSARRRSSFGDAMQRSPKRLFPFPRGVNMKSAFDYVFYPFPETRAHEVVQHEQISREMSQRGIMSEGPRAEFLINRPPRHARDPADLSGSDRWFGPFDLIRTAIQRLFPQRQRVPDAKRPKINTLPSRCLPRSSALKPRPLPIDSKARVHKSTSTAAPKLRLRGGGGPPLHRSAASLNGKRAFDPLAYRRMMMAIFRRELETEYGRSVTFEEPRMLRLLNSTSYDVQKAVQLYQSSSGDKSVGFARNTANEPRRSVRAGKVVSHQAATKMDRHRRLFRQTPAGDSAEIYAYRMNTVAQPVSGPFEALPAGEYGDDADHNYGHRHFQRPVLGELPVGADARDDGSDDDHNHDHQLLQRPVLGELPLCVDPHDGDGGDDSTQHSSNQENHTPGPPDPPQPPRRSPSPEPIHWRCHPCPVFEGQYHHVCVCTGVVSPRPTPDFPIHEDENAVERPNLDSSPRSTSRQRGNSAGDHGGRQTGSRAGSQAGSQASHQAEDQAENQAPRRRPRREDARDDDGLYVHEVFARDPGYTNALRDLGSDGALYQVVTDIFSPQPNWITNPRLREKLCTTLDALVTEIMTLRDQYLALLEAPEPFMEAVTTGDVRAPNPDVPATFMICQRATNEVKQHYDRLFQFFDGNQSRPHLGFRRQFNRLIVAVRELRLLFLEHCQAAVDDGNVAGSQQQPGRGSRRPSQEDNQEESSDDTHTDSEATLSSAETARVASGRPPARRINVVPTRAQYELMFLDELEREMRHRGFANVAQTLGKNRYKKVDVIDKLMEFDREGTHLGSGADNGYRHLSGLLTARTRPKGFNLEDMIRQGDITRVRLRLTLKAARKRQRQEARNTRGMHSPASVRPRVSPNRQALPAGAARRPRAGVPSISSQSSEESDTPSPDYRKVR